MTTTHFSNGDFLIFLHHHHHSHHQKSHFSSFLHQYVAGGHFPPPPSPPYFTTSAAIAAEYTSHHHVLHICRSSRWDSNAESYVDDEENEDIMQQQFDDNLQEYIDSLWILKVFRSYGVMLPFIIFTMIITTGLKAFLLALAVPLGQSTFFYAIQKMLQEKSSSTKPRQKTKNNKGSYTPSSQQKNVKKKVRKTRDSYNNGNKDSADQEALSYGGWDEV